MRRTTRTFCDIGALDKGLVDRGLERAGRPPPVAPVGRDDEVGVAVEDATSQGVGGEPAEDHRVRCPQTGAGQHGDDGLGDHRHVDGDLVARPHTQFDQAHWLPGSPAPAGPGR